MILSLSKRTETGPSIAEISKSSSSNVGIKVEESDVLVDNNHSDENELIIDTQRRPKNGGMGREKGGVVVTQIVPQVEMQTCALDKKSLVISGTSEEEAWLEAVESGNLQKVESCDSELRSLREPSMMTARQRALASGSSGDIENDNLGMLDFGGKTSKVDKEMTEEDKVEKMVKAQKRKEMETEKREKMKQKTMDTLLKKKDSKVTKQIKTSKTLKEDIPKISFIANSSGYSLSFPEGHEYPLSASGKLDPPTPILCCMCSKTKKYCSSKTGQPVCSLACYKENLAQVVT